MNPQSRPSFTEVVQELEKTVTDGEQSRCVEPDVPGESANKYCRGNVLPEAESYKHTRSHSNLSVLY